MAIEEFAVFDRKYWSAFDACFIASIMPDSTQEQIEKLTKELHYHRNKKPANALSFMLACAMEESKDKRFQSLNIVYNRFLKLCKLYQTYFDLDEPITPRQFINWARQRDSIDLPPIMNEWYEHVLKKTEIKRKKQLKNHITHNKDIDSFFREYPICHELYKLFLEGKSRAEMVIDLTSRNLATNLQAGWLTKTDKRYQSDFALKKEVGRMKTPKKAE